MHVVDKNIFQAVISGIARATFKRKEFSADNRFLPLYPSPLHPVKRKIRGMGGGGGGGLSEILCLHANAFLPRGTIQVM